MIDLNHLRTHPELYQLAAKRKRIDVDIHQFLKMDTHYRDLLKHVEDMRAAQNSVSKRMPNMKGEEKETAMTEMKKLSKGLKEKEEELKNAEIAWREMQLLLPSLPLPSVPVGETEKDNTEAHAWGDPPKFSFEPKDH